MRDLAGRIAVVTGAGSGLGRELAVCAAGRGMDVVGADIDESGLRATAALVKEAGRRCLEVKTDVSKAEDVENLAARTYETFGAAHVLFNNAGVNINSIAWEATVQDWQWVLGVNLMGVVHGIRSFVPRMLESGVAAHIVSVASGAGLMSVPESAVYCVSKHGVVTLSECLHHDLRARDAAIGVSVMCPAFMKTAIMESARNRPPELAQTVAGDSAIERRIRRAIDSARLTTADVAEITLKGVEEGRFYILPHPKLKAGVEARLHDILDDRLPTNPMP